MDSKRINSRILHQHKKNNSIRNENDFVALKTIVRTNNIRVVRTTEILNTSSRNDEDEHKLAKVARKDRSAGGESTITRD